MDSAHSTNIRNISDTLNRYATYLRARRTWYGTLERYAVTVELIDSAFNAIASDGDETTERQTEIGHLAAEARKLPARLHREMSKKKRKEQQYDLFVDMVAAFIRQHA